MTGQQHVHPLRRLYHRVSFHPQRYRRTLFIALIAIYSLSTVVLFRLLDYPLPIVSATLIGIAVGDIGTILLARWTRRSFAKLLEQWGICSVPRFLALSLTALPAFLLADWRDLILIVPQLIGSLAYLQGFVIEPGWLHISRHRMQSGHVKRDLRFVHLSDIHVARLSVREEKALRIIGRFQPDYVFLTGDYLNLSHIHDPQAHEDLINFLKELTQIAPVIACVGSPMVDPRDQSARLLQAAGVRLLGQTTEQESWHSDADGLQVLAQDCSHHLSRDESQWHITRQLQRADSLRVFLFHSPELGPAIENESGMRPDIYLCGHTHGGQIRFWPFGALFTSSSTGLRFQQGAYQLADCRLYVSAGMGLEGGPAPRMRLFCRPEIGFWQIKGLYD
ncbi:MAG: metallophosphoesterase [Leptospiraceae bacterium]|nr:metallophosphoesterase [Leptospiraceae bacterium]